MSEDGYPIRWLDFGQPRLQLIVPPWFEDLCAEQGTTPQEVYDRGLGPPCDVITYRPQPEVLAEPSARDRLAEACAAAARAAGLVR